MRQATSIIFAVTVVVLTSVAGADVIREATAVIINQPGNGDGTVITNYINQSGLVTNYVSGTTDFDTYNPSSVANTGMESESWRGLEFTNGFTDFDLGVSDVVTRVAKWSFAQATDNQTGPFQVYVSDDPTFFAASPFGPFELLDNSSGGQSLGQVFDIPDTQGQYVRIEHILTQGGTFVGGSEVAFATTSAVPEPTAASIVWLALSGMAWMLRRKRS